MLSVLHAQDTTAYQSDVDYNIIRFTPGKLLQQSIGLSYERVISSKLSIGLGVNVFPERSLPQSLLSPTFFRELLEAQAVLTDEVSLGTSVGVVDSGGVRGALLTPEIRFYPGFIGSPYGFYLLGFARYMEYSADALVSQAGGSSGELDLFLQFSGFGGGVGIGVQRFIADVISIDWNIGFGLIPASLKIRGNTPADITADPYLQSLQDKIRQLPATSNFVIESFADDVGEVDAQGNLLWPILRGNLSIGIAF
ncbi:MAG: hypothetical protein AAFP92_09970 [Bacteroidota bacterium]